MANTNVFFRLFAGDDETINLTAIDDSGATINISSASAIVWKLAQDERSTATVTKSLGSGVALVGGGSGGIFSVAIDAADSTGLDGTYYHSATVTLSSDVTHVTIGTIWFRPAI